MYVIAQRRQIREASDRSMFNKTKAKFSAPDLRTDALITNERLKLVHVARDDNGGSTWRLQLSPRLQPKTWVNPDLMCVVVSLALSSPPLLTALHCLLLPLAGT